MRRDDELLLEIHGSGIKAKTFDALEALRVGSAYFELLHRVAQDNGTELTLKGLAVREKCFAWKVEPSNFLAARDAGWRAAKFLSGESKPPPQLVRHVDQLSTAIRRLPFDANVTAAFGDCQIPLLRIPKLLADPPWEQLAVRATILGLGSSRASQRIAQARFSSRSEERPFTLRLKDDESLCKLGKHFSSALDIEARVQRDEHDVIVDGELLDFEPVPTGVNDLAVWRAWYRDNMNNWDAIDDVEGELRGYDD